MKTTEGSEREKKGQVTDLPDDGQWLAAAGS